MSAVNAYKQWAGNDPVRYLYTDCSQELNLIARMYSIPHDTSEPGDPQANGLAERHVQETKYGTASGLGQAGLPHGFWCYAMQHFEIVWNITKHQGRAKTPWELRFGAVFGGQVIPFGARVTFIPNRASRLWKLKRPFGQRTIEGIFSVGSSEQVVVGQENIGLCRFRHLTVSP